MSVSTQALAAVLRWFEGGKDAWELWKAIEDPAEREFVQQLLAGVTTLDEYIHGLKEVLRARGWRWD